MCVSFQHFRNFKKSMKPKRILEYICKYTFWHTTDSKNYKNIKKTYLWFKNVKNVSLKLDLQIPRLADFSPACPEALYYNFTMICNEMEWFAIIYAVKKFLLHVLSRCLTLSWRKSLSYRNQSINLQSKAFPIKTFPVCYSSGKRNKKMHFCSFFISQMSF